MNVDRCVCANLTFVSLKQTARAEGLDFEGLRERTGCCRICSMCAPYVKKMLATGRTSFAPMPMQEEGGGGGGGRERSR